jgi:uncharacterized protein YdeI (YjbR/CyaY-like superfamily)
VSGAKKFRGVLEHDGTSLNWTIVRVPFNPVQTWPGLQRLRVCGAINGFAFRTSLFSNKRLGFLLLVNKTMQRGACVRVGSDAEILLEPDTAERPVSTPPELARILHQSKRLERWHGRLNPSIRKYLADTVARPRSPEARAKTAELMAERMLLAMEGERQTPPILEVAFQRSSAARQGWLAMTPIQRRNHLLGIFYYRSPESRQKRARQAIEHALRVAARRKREPERNG